MHVPGDLGFSSLVLAVLCLAFTVVIFVIRRKWRIAVAKNEEIKKLLVLASEEAARVEFEATVSYSAVPVPRNVYQCAVCYCPTTTRCAQCKAVRYCSGKCQIIHWRQGHKYNCHRPTILNDDGTDFGKEVAEKNEPDIHNASWEDAPTETSSIDRACSDSTWSPELASKTEEDTRVDFISHTTGMDSISDSSSTLFSGFSSPASSGELSDEASVSESISSNDAEGPDKQSSTDVTPDILRSGLNKRDQPEPLSPKFAKLADSSNYVSYMTNLNEVKKVSNSYNPSSPSPNIRATSELVIPAVVEDNNAQSNTVKTAKTKLSGSEPNLQFKFSMSRTDALSSQKLSEGKKFKSVEAPSREAAPRNFNVDAPRISKSANSDSYTLMKNGSSGGSKIIMDHELRAVSLSCSPHTSSNGGDVSKVAGSTFSAAKGSNLVASDNVTASHSSNSRLPPYASECNPCSTSGCVLPNVKVVKVEDVEGSPVTTNQSGTISSNSIGGLRLSMRKVVDQFRGPKSGRYSHKGLFPYDLFVKLYSHKVDLQPCGLINCGNRYISNGLDFNIRAQWFFCCQILLAYLATCESKLAELASHFSLPNWGRRIVQL